MSPMFSEMAGQNVTNGTFPKTLGPKASTYVGYTVIQVLMQLWCGKRKEAFWYPQPFVHTLCAFSQINAPVSNISKLAFFKCILKTECFKTFCQRSIRSIPYKLSGKTKFSMASCSKYFSKAQTAPCKSYFLSKIPVAYQSRGFFALLSSKGKGFFLVSIPF